MRLALQKVVTNSMFIITTISVLLGLAMINLWVGLAVGLIISLFAISTNSMFRLKPSSSSISLRINLRYLIILLGAIGISLLLNLIYISLLLAGLMTKPVIALPDIFNGSWIEIVGFALLVGIGFELIISAYLQRGLAYVLGDSQKSWILSSVILSFLFGISIVEFGLLTRLIVTALSMYLLVSKMINREQVIMNVILNTVIFIWLGIQKILIQDILFTEL